MTVNEVQRSEGNKSGGPKKNEIARRQIDRLVHDLSQKLAASQHKIKINGMDDLGPRTKSYLTNLYPELVGAVQPDGAIPRPMLKRIRNEMFKLATLEQHVMSGPADGAANGAIDGRKIRVDNDGVKGLGDGALRSLLKGFGLEQGYDAVGGAIVDKVLSDNGGADVTKPETWQKVGGQILDALISSEGDLGKRVGNAIGAGTSAILDAVLESPRMNKADAAKRTGSIDKNFGPVPNAGLGLERTAAKEANTGSINNAFAIRAQLLTGITGQNEQIRNVTAKTLKEVFRDLGVFQNSAKNTGEDRIAKRKIHELVGGELQKLQKDDGTIDAADMFDRFSQMVAERSGDDPASKAFAELSGGLKQIVQAHPEAATSEDVQTCLALGASMALSDLVGLELGKEVSHRDSLNEQVVPMLSELIASGGFSDAKRPRPEGEVKVDLSRYDRAMPQFAQARVMAVQYLDSMAEACTDKSQIAGTPFDKNSPQYNVFANILSEVFTTADTAQQPPCVAAYQWLVDNAGLNPSFLEPINQSLDGIASEIERLGTLYEHAQKQYDAESKNIGTGQNHARLQQLSMEMAKYRAKMEEAATKPLEYLQHASKLIAATVMDGRRHGDGNVGDVPPPHTPSAANGAGGAGDGGGGGHNNGPGGPGGPKDPRRGGNYSAGGGDHGGNWGRGGVRSRGAMASITSPAGPHDQDDAPFYQRRANMLGDILSDSCLCIEDKIFFFMMWFVAFADDEREQKMKEMIEMDRKQAETAEARDKHTGYLKEQQEKVKTFEDVKTQAESDLAKLHQADPPDPAAIAEAEAALEAATENLDIAKEHESDLERTVQDLTRQVDELPKSREVKFMELERINQLRDKIMNMARSILENSNRNIEKIFR